jgi:hypothetical protein
MAEESWVAWGDRREAIFRTRKLAPSAWRLATCAENLPIRTGVVVVEAVAEFNNYFWTGEFHHDVERVLRSVVSRWTYFFRKPLGIERLLR